MRKIFKDIFMNKSRIIFLDYVRAIALFLVVFAHLYSVDSEVKLYIYAFNMPVFFLISGFLHKESATVPLIKKMARRMLVPFCFFLFLGYLFCAISSKSLALGTAYASIRGIILGKDIAANDILWFLLALFGVSILGNIFIKKPLLYGLPLTVLFFVLCLTHTNILYLGSSMMALPFYLAGYYGESAINFLVKKKWSVLISVLCLLGTVILTHFNGKVSMMGMKFGNTSSDILNFVLFYINGLVGSMMLICLSGLFNRETKIVSLMSRCSISIVGLQFIPIILWMNYFGFNKQYWLSALYSILIIVFAIVFHLIVEKKSNWLLGGK